MNLLKKFKILLLLIFLVYIGIIIRGCFSENIRHSLDLSIDVQANDLCLYTNNSNHFLDESDNESYFFVWISPFNSDIDIFEKKIMLKDRVFPFKKENCILVPLSSFEINKPYAFLIETGKPFKKNACILRDKNGKYRITDILSVDSCNH